MDELKQESKDGKQEVPDDLPERKDPNEEKNIEALKAEIKKLPTEKLAQLSQHIDQYIDKQKNLPPRKRLFLSLLLIGLARDFAWGATTFSNQDFFEGKIGSFFGPTITQMTVTLICMLVTVIQLDKIISKQLNTLTPATLIQHCELVLPAWTAILPWNAAQVLGKYVGRRLGMSELAAGLLAGVFTGAAETIWQNGVMLPLILRQKIQILELLFTAFSGAVWQWVLQYNVSTNANSEIYVGANIAIAVAFTTLTMTLLAWTIEILMKIRKERGGVNENTPLLSGDSLKRTYEKHGLMPQISQQQQSINTIEQQNMEPQTLEPAFT